MSTHPLTPYFETQPNTLSVHFKTGQVIHAKTGEPGKVTYQEINEVSLDARELIEMIEEIQDFAEQDDDSYLELDKDGCQVYKCQDTRITITYPPFSDRHEITAVRPNKLLDINDYQLSHELKSRLFSTNQGVLISGNPGGGKSTFAAAVAKELDRFNYVVKTMEQPRDLQVPDRITQYNALQHDMKQTSEILLLVRPDYVIYDEVRTTEDFENYADLRLAGVGLIGITHANQAIDAIQRLSQRLDLGAIPQVLQTVIHINNGGIEQVLTLEYTVKVPDGMQSDDLARPVIRIHDYQQKKVTHEIYTFGEQTVIMPLDQIKQTSSGLERHAQSSVETTLKKHIKGAFKCTIKGNTVTIQVPKQKAAGIVGKGGAKVRQLEEELGMRIDVRTS